MNRALIIGTATAAILGTAILNSNSESAGSVAFPQMSGASSTIARDLRGDLEALGITYSDVGDVSVSEGAEVRETVQEQFGAFLDPDGVYSVQGVRFTDRNFGKSANADSSDAAVDLYFVDAAAQMIVLTHQPVPVFAPKPPDDGKSDAKAVVDSTFVAFVDAATGDVLRAVSFSQPAK